MKNNIFICTKKELSGFNLVKPSKQCYYQDGDIIIISEEKNKITCAKLSKSSALVSKSIEVSNSVKTYRKPL